MLSSFRSSSRLKYSALPRAASGLYTPRCWSSCAASSFPSASAAEIVRAFALVSLSDDRSAVFPRRLPLHAKATNQATGVYQCKRQKHCIPQAPDTASRRSTLGSQPCARTALNLHPFSQPTHTCWLPAPAAAASQVLSAAASGWTPAEAAALFVSPVLAAHAGWPSSTAGLQSSTTNAMHCCLVLVKGRCCGVRLVHDGQTTSAATSTRRQSA